MDQGGRKGGRKWSGRIEADWRQHLEKLSDLGIQEVEKYEMMKSQEA